MMKNCCWLIWAQKSGGNFRTKKRFSQIWFLGRNIFLCKKSYQYSKSNLTLFGPIVKNCVGSFSRRYCQFGLGQKVYFFWFGTQISTDSQCGHLGLTFVKNNWWGVWPSCQMMKNYCWPIWTQMSGKNFRPKKQFSQIWFLDRENFLCLKYYQYPNSNSPLFGPIVGLEVFHADIANLARYRKWVYLNGHFWALWPLHTPGMA